MKNIKPRKNDQHFIITVSDKQQTRHFRVYKFIKPMILSVSLVMVIAVLGISTLFFQQRDTLIDTRVQADELENTFVKLSAKNSSLNRQIEASHSDQEVMSEVLAQMEQISGVNSDINTSIIDRMTAISEYFASKELDFVELDDRVEDLEESIGITNDSSESDSDLAERIELAQLNISQRKLLHDSIPNGYPTRNLGVTSAYGKRIHPTTKQSSYHNGIDLKAAEGTDIYATADGVVKHANFNKLSGNRIVLSHNLGFESRYAHLSEMKVKAGEVVQKGDVIGSSGNTGRSDGPHLHYEVRYLDKAYDPVDFLKWEFGDQQIFSNVRGIQWESLISLLNKQISRPTLQLSQLVHQ